MENGSSTLTMFLLERGHGPCLSQTLPMHGSLHGIYTYIDPNIPQSIGKYGSPINACPFHKPTLIHFYTEACHSLCAVTTEDQTGCASPKSHTLHACHICLHWVGFGGQWRQICESHACLGIGSKEYLNMYTGILEVPKSSMSGIEHSGQLDLILNTTQRLGFTASLDL